MSPPPWGPLRLDREIGGASPFRSMTSSPWQKVAPPWVANIFALRVHVGGRGGVVLVYIYIYSVQHLQAPSKKQPVSSPIPSLTKLADGRWGIGWGIARWCF